jgi:hypothetical protein
MKGSQFPMHSKAEGAGFGAFFKSPPRAIGLRIEVISGRVVFQAHY